MKKDIAMTPEEKAKAYDEAMNKIKPLYEQAKRDGNPIWSTYEYLIPELREEEKPLTPFQQCLNWILRVVYYAEVPYKEVNEFILKVVRTRTDELIKLAKRHEYTDCQLHESENEKMMQEFNDWLCEEIECRTSSLCDEKDRRTLNMLCYVLTKVKEWLGKQKESLHVSKSCKENTDSFTDEDERIRKWIYGLVENLGYPADEDAKKELDEMQPLALSWLEKQKEEEGYEAIPVESTLEYKLGFKAGKESEKQKEQKSVEKPKAKEYNTPNKKFFQWIYDRLIYVHRENPNIDYMRSLKDRIEEMKKEQKPISQEDFDTAKHEALWGEQKPVQSAEEKEFVRTIKSIIADFIRDKKPEDVGFYQQIYDWLDGRHIEPKPVEWSDEDEEHLKNVLFVLESYVSRSESASSPSLITTYPTYYKEIDWLKSLRPTKDCDGCPKHLEGYISGRSDAENKLLEMYGILLMPDGELRMKPQWKPSKEQLDALEECGECKRCIKNLYEQLKKLM